MVSGSVAFCVEAKSPLYMRPYSVSIKSGFSDLAGELLAVLGVYSEKGNRFESRSRR